MVCDGTEAEGRDLGVRGPLAQPSSATLVCTQYVMPALTFESDPRKRFDSMAQVGVTGSVE